MKVDIFNVDDFTKINSLDPVVNPLFFDKGAIPTEDGLFSFTIFGNNEYDRKTIFSYIPLNGHFLHPLVYKTLKRMDMNAIDNIVYGRAKYIVNKEGDLVQDENGWTGLEEFYKNYDKIKFKPSKSTMRQERIDALSKLSKDEVFLTKCIVIPPFYRDIDLASSNGNSIGVGDVNKIYSDIIRFSKMIEDNNDLGMDIFSNGTRARVQNLLVDVYDFFKSPPNISKKQGHFRSSLLGRSVIYGVRAVISAPKIRVESVDDMMVDFDHVGIPLAMACTLFYPFILKWLNDYFYNEFVTAENKYPIREGDKVVYVELDNPQALFNTDYFSKQIKKFIRSYNGRFEKIEIPVKDSKKKYYMHIAGRFAAEGNTSPSLESPIISRPATWTDLLYMAAHEVTKDKHVICTRYPVEDYFGVFAAKVTVLSTTTTTPMYVSNRYYKYYPVVPTDGNDDSSNSFIDTLQISNMYLEGIGGDYDGDQLSIRGVFTKEANDELHAIMNNVSNVLNISGGMMRGISKEAVQCIYNLTE